MTDAGQIAAIGSRGAVGLSSRQVAMCARARSLEPRALEHLVDKHGYEVCMCLCAGIPLEVVGYHRLVALAAPAARDAMAGYYGPPVAAVVALPERDRADDDPRFETQFIADLAARSAIPIDTDVSRVVRCGHAGGAFALEIALQLATSRPVLVGGVDSYYHPDLLAQLDRDYRLHSVSTFNGFIPSEAAAFCLLAAEAPTLARVCHVATGMESSAVSEDEVNIATASTALMAHALEHRPLAWIMSDINGEQHRVREWSMVEIRHRLAAPVVHDRMVEGVGDVGAASGLLFLNAACEYWQTGCAPAARLAIALHSEGAERGLVVAEAAS